MTDRYETLLAGLRERGMTLAAGHDAPFSSAEDFLSVAILAGRATAVIAYDHRIATTLVGAAHARGLRIPQDFSLVCFNDVFPVSLLPPPLTAVTVSGRDMGRIGADLLLNTLAGTTPQPPREIRVPEDLVVRASTGPPPQIHA